MEGTWREVKVITTSESLEPISGIFYTLDCMGVAIEDPRDILDREQGPLTWDFADLNILEYKGKAAFVKGYFSEDDNIDETVKYIEEKVEEIKEMGVDVGEGKVYSTSMKEEDWANNWKKYYKPTKVGEKIVVKPIWEDYEVKDNEVVVELDPGMAFGTGTHETTRMCIQSLEKYVKPENVVFDIGTGSGILGIAAAKLGAKKVIAVDLDPVAVDSAKENVAFNNIENIEVLYGDLMEVVEGKADIVVANIIAEIIVLLADGVKDFINEGGHFITSGIILAKKQMVIDKLNQCGFTIEEIKEDGEWACIVARV